MGLPLPVLWTAVTTGLAIIPFGGLVTYLVASAWLFAAGNTAKAIGITIWGHPSCKLPTTLFVSAYHGHRHENAVLAYVIRNPARVETFGLIDLFIGLSIMALLATL